LLNGDELMQEGVIENQMPGTPGDGEPQDAQKDRDETD
jgi:hypothetical protein